MLKYVQTPSASDALGPYAQLGLALVYEAIAVVHTVTSLLSGRYVCS
jgi:hypothetical protein